jgi:ElaB/YqjD/DUF883 family membrane-anchored ribosome-binding protein
VSTDTHLGLSASEIAEDATRMKRRASTIARNTVEALEDKLGGGLADTVKEAAEHAGDTLEISREYVRRNPWPALLGAAALGAATGYMLMATRRNPNSHERHTRKSLTAAHDAILRALAPVSRRIHQGYDSAREGAGRAMDRVDRLGSKHVGDSLSHQMGRIGNKLKFW